MAQLLDHLVFAAPENGEAREALARAYEAGLRETFSDDLDVDGSRLALLRFMRFFDKPTGTFAIVTPG